MKDASNATNVREPRKQVRIQLRRDLVVTPQRFEGRQHYVVKDPIGLRYWRFQEREHFLFQHLDGKHTLDDVRVAYEVTDSTLPCRSSPPRWLSGVSVTRRNRLPYTLGIP